MARRGRRRVGALNPLHRHPAAASASRAPRLGAKAVDPPAATPSRLNPSAQSPPVQSRPDWRSRRPTATLRSDPGAWLGPDMALSVDGTGLTKSASRGEN